VHCHLSEETDGHFSNLRRFLILGGPFIPSVVLAIKRGTKMSLSFVEAAHRVSEKLDELPLRAATEAVDNVGGVGDDRFR